MSSMDARIVAFTPLGNSEAIAVIAAAIFFIAGVISIANLLYTSETLPEYHTANLAKCAV